MIYQVLGFINVALVVLITAPFWLRILNTKFFKIKSEGFKKLLRGLRKLHKPLAAVLLVNVVIHGYLALGGLKLHTGTLAALCIYITALLGICFFISKKIPLLKGHRVFAMVAVLTIALHLLLPNLFSGIA